MDKSTPSAIVISPACGRIGPFGFDEAKRRAREISEDQPGSFAKAVLGTTEVGFVDGGEAVLENGIWRRKYGWDPYDVQA
jgi:hypothetical protein